MTMRIFDLVSFFSYRLKQYFVPCLKMARQEGANDGVRSTSWGRLGKSFGGKNNAPTPLELLEVFPLLQYVLIVPIV